MKKIITLIFVISFSIVSLYSFSYDAGLGIAPNMKGNPGIVFQGGMKYDIIPVEGLYAIFGARVAINSYQYTVYNSFLIPEQHTTVSSYTGIYFGARYDILNIFEDNILIPFIGMGGNFSYYSTGETDNTGKSLSGPVIRPEINVGTIISNQIFFLFDITQPLYVVIGVVF